jgi:hypothetical protein
MKFTISHETPAAKIGYHIIPAHLRGKIKGEVVNKFNPLGRKGGDKTNQEYATENGISKRQASKQRRGY